MNEEVLGAKSLPPTSETDQTVVPAVGCPSASVQRNAVPPQSWTSIPRCNLYQARSDTASLALKKMPPMPVTLFIDRKSTRLNSSHSQISYAVFCLKKKKKNNTKSTRHKYTYVLRVLMHII